MENLYLETSNGNIPIDETIVEKYHLEKGFLSPFTRNRIVGEDGEYTRKEPIRDIINLEQKEDEISEMGYGFQLSTSEMLDIAEGVDSD